MNQDASRSISRALEELALALGQGGAVPRAELVRALERAADRLRTPRQSGAAPSDLVSQAEAARLVGVSRQAVNQWVRKGVLQAHPGGGGSGRASQQVSLSEISVVANRGGVERFSGTLGDELASFLEEVGRLDGLRPIAEGVARALAPHEPAGLSDVGSRVLRDFFLGAMGSTVAGDEFTASGVHMLADLVPGLQVDPQSRGADLLDSLNLVVHSRDGRMGFDSASAAVLGLLGAATIGARHGDARGEIGQSVARSARKVWDGQWVDRLFDAAAHIDELEAPPLTRYTAPLVYLGCNRFMRQAQVDGVSITYAASPGAILPQSYYGGAVFAELMHGREPVGQPWQVSEVGPSRSTPTGKSPFRVFNFAHGLFDPSIHGIRRYCFEGASARAELRSYADSLGAAERVRYVELTINTLAQTLQKPFVEMSVVEEPASFDWWKAHLIRSSPRETLIGLRGERARAVAHGLLVRSSAIPQLLETTTDDNDLRDRLRLYVKNLDFEFINERYGDDRSRGVTRLLKDASERLGPDEAVRRAEAEVDRLLRG